MYQENSKYENTYEQMLVIKTHKPPIYQNKFLQILKTIFFITNSISSTSESI